MAAGGSIKRASIHVEEVHHHHQAPLRRAAEVDPPAEGLSSALPFRHSPFVGRGEELARLDAALADPGGVVVQAVWTAPSFVETRFSLLVDLVLRSRRRW